MTPHPSPDPSFTRRAFEALLAQRGRASDPSDLQALEDAARDPDLAPRLAATSAFLDRVRGSLDAQAEPRHVARVLATPRRAESAPWSEPLGQPSPRRAARWLARVAAVYLGVALAWAVVEVIGPASARRPIVDLPQAGALSAPLPR